MVNPPGHGVAPGSPEDAETTPQTSPAVAASDPEADEARVSRYAGIAEPAPSSPALQALPVVGGALPQNEIRP